MSPSSGKKLQASSRFAKKKQSAIKKRSYVSNRVLSPHYETGATPKPIKSRFSSRITRTSPSVRNLEGSLKKAEKSIRSAIAAKPFDTLTDSASDVAPRTRFAKDLTPPKQSPSSATKGSEYTVNFGPGPIGLKLEPVLKNGDKEFGCRVIKLMTSGKGTTSPSQALKSGKINVGDVLTAVNGNNITSKSYKEIVSLLTSSGERDVTFRIPRSPAQVMPTTPASMIRPSSKNVATGNGESQREETMLETPAQSNKTSTIEAPRIFSPSSVKKMNRSTVKDASVFYSSRHQTKPLSDVLSTVMKSVAPAAAKSTRVASLLSKEIGHVFAGISSKEADETIHMKMELLSELSQAKSSLGEQEKNMQMMTKIMDNIHKEKVAVQTEKSILQDELSEAQKAKVSLLFSLSSLSAYQFN